MSLIIPVTQRRKATVPMKFSHRLFQEFFTARYVRKNAQPSDGLQVSVRNLLEEMS